MVSPSGKECSFASGSYASYALVTVGPQHFSLASAFLEPTRGKNILDAAIKDLKTQFEAFNRAYDITYESGKQYELNVITGSGSISGLTKFIESNFA
jgi:hypothetical protein